LQSGFHPVLRELTCVNSHSPFMTRQVLEASSIFSQIPDLIIFSLGSVNITLRQNSSTVHFLPPSCFTLGSPARDERIIQMRA
jgi:hypothetical protein